MRSESGRWAGAEPDRMNPFTSILTPGRGTNSLRVRAIEPRLGYRGSSNAPWASLGCEPGLFCPAYKSMRPSEGFRHPRWPNQLARDVPGGDVSCVKVATSYRIVTYASFLIRVLAPHLIHILLKGGGNLDRGISFLGGSVRERKDGAMAPMLARHWVFIGRGRNHP
jgi:hypothetical protein